MKVFCFPYLGASSAIFNSWKSIIGKENLYLIDYPGHGTKLNKELIYDLNALANAVYFEIRSKLSEPYIFYGHSMGALICYELIKLISKEDAPLPLHFIVSGHRAPHLKRLETRMQNLSEEDFIIKFQECYQSIPDEILNDKDARDIFIPILQADMAALENYQHSEDLFILPCEVTAVHGTLDNHATYDEMNEWNKYTHKFQSHEIDADHLGMLKSMPQLVKTIMNGYDKNR